MADRDLWQWNIPEYFNIGAACTDAHLESGAATRVAMMVEDDQTGISSATFAQLARNSSQFAQLLRNHGADAGDRVLIRLPNSLDFPTAFLGTMKRGAVAVPTSTLLVAEEVRYLAQNSGALFMVTHKSMWPELKDQLSDLQTLNHVFLAGDGLMPEAETHLSLHDLPLELAQIGHFESTHPTRAEDPAYLVYTSGVLLLIPTGSISGRATGFCIRASSIGPMCSVPD